MSKQFRTTLRVADGGRIVIPAAVRDHLDMQIGTDLVLTMENDHATLMNAKSARRKAREKVGKYVQSNVSLSNELMTERKIEARRD